MPRSLVSFWKRVATSGPTVDGREILPQELRDVAETYTPSKYTAVIWAEHERWSGSHGTVFAVRLVEEADDLEPGQVALEAQLKPNQKLLWLNDQGEKLFTSVEILPNFANSGKAYLTGLAVTDEPASLGTQELYFSNRTNKAAYYAASVELGNLSEEKPQGEISKLAAMFTSLLRHFGVEQTTDTPKTPTESKIPMDEATGTALKALRDQLMIIMAGLDVVIEGAAADAPEPDAVLLDDVQAVVDEVVTTAEEERAFRLQKNGNQALLKSINDLKKEFNALKNTPTGRQVPKVAGPAVATKKRVF